MTIIEKREKIETAINDFIKVEIYNKKRKFSSSAKGIFTVQG